MGTVPHLSGFCHREPPVQGPGLLRRVLMAQSRLLPGDAGPCGASARLSMCSSLIHPFIHSFILRCAALWGCREDSASLRGPAVLRGSRRAVTVPRDKGWTEACAHVRGGAGRKPHHGKSPSLSDKEMVLARWPSGGQGSRGPTRTASPGRSRDSDNLGHAGRCHS